MISIEIRAKPAAPGRPAEEGGQIQIDASGDELFIKTRAVRYTNEQTFYLDRREMRVLRAALRAEISKVRTGGES